MEATITINGAGLTDAQAAVIRAAIEEFDISLRESKASAQVPAHMADAYLARISEIRDLLYRQ
jgi:hypothetical protein